MPLYRRRRVVRKRRVARPMRMLGMSYRRKRVTSVKSFKETYAYPSTIFAPATTLGVGIINFKISSLVNFSNLAGLYDLYKITGAKVKIIPRYTQASLLENNAIPSGALPVLHIAPNRNPYVPPPTTLGDVLNDDGVKSILLNKPVTLWLKAPKPDITTGGETPTPVPMQFGVSSKYQPWLTTGGNGQLQDQSGVPHYGFRWALDNQASVPADAQIFVTLYFKMKEQD